MGPIDYSAAIVNPLQSVLQGFQLGTQLRAAQRERQAAARDQEFLKDLQSLPTSATGSKDFMRIATKYPDKFEQLNKFWGGMNEVKRGFLLDTGAAALRTLTPNPDGSFDTTATVSALEERAIAAENSGDKATAKEIRDIAAMVKLNPAAARTTIGMTLIQADKDKGKAIVDAAFGGNDLADLDKGYALNVRLFGKEQADRWRAAEQAKSGVITATGPAGTTYVPALNVAPMLAADSAAAPPPNAPQAGVGTPAAPAKVVSSQQEAMRLPPGTEFIYNGQRYRVPGGQTATPSGGFQGR